MPATAKPAPVIDKSGRVGPPADDPIRAETFLPSPCVQNHAANIMPLRNGDLGCVWFGGTQEGMADISIYFSRLRRRTGSMVRSREAVGRSLALGAEPNPVSRSGRPPVAVLDGAEVRQQDTAFVRYRISEDDGRSWGPIEVLVGPQEGCGTFIRQPLVVLDNGDWLLPVFYCYGSPGRKWVGDDDTSAVKISSDGGQTWSEVEVPNSTGCVHMNIVKLGDGSLLALFRSRWADHIYESRSRDNGRSWSEPIPTALPNNNSSIQVTRLANGHLALVFNDINKEGITERRASLYDEIEDDDEEPVAEAAPEPPHDPNKRTAYWGVPRAPMTLAISEDDGRTWTRKRNLEVGDGYCMTNNSREQTNREYSYPSIKQGPDGALHIAFTYFRQAIKYVRVPELWVP